MGNQKWHTVLWRGHTDGAEDRGEERMVTVGHTDALESTEGAQHCDGKSASVRAASRAKGPPVQGPRQESHCFEAILG